jgi:hypothetical protein
MAGAEAEVKQYRVRLNQDIYNAAREQALRHGQLVGVFLRNLCDEYFDSHQDPERIPIYPGLEEYCLSRNPTRRSASSQVAISLSRHSSEVFDKVIKLQKLKNSELFTNIILLTIVNVNP